MNNQPNQDLITLVQSTQQTSRWMMASSAISTLTAAITSGILIWKSLKRDRTSSKVRLIRQVGRIDKIKLRHQAEMARELLELDIIEREAKHEAELRELEVGLEKKEEKEVISETDNFIDKLKNKGQAILNKKIGEVTEQMNKVKDKIPNPLDNKEKN